MCDGQAAEQAIRLILNAGGEIERVGIAALAGSYRPEITNRDWFAVTSHQLPDKLIGILVENVDVLRQVF